MLEVNLSRLHNMIRNVNNEISQIQTDLSSVKGIYTLNILRATTEEDLEEFKKRIKSRRENVLAKKQRLELCLDYIAYLKNILDDENSRKGISEKLQAISALQRKESELWSFASKVSDFCSQEWQFNRSVDYYKSAFTEEKPVYELSLHLFNADFLGELRKERDAIRSQRQRLEDELSSLNQSLTVTIMSIEEFADAKC